LPENRFLTLSLANNLLFILSILKKCLFLQPIKIVLTLKTIIEAEQGSATKKKKSKNEGRRTAQGAGSSAGSQKAILLTRN